ncbi:MAG: rhomboid family intramembrane serine protease [Candidatus Glassbacteria bacterium]|nr:rhomboid family intramembrane serine protease [Candidatus Glassbacteria bacterium]
MRYNPSYEGIRYSFGGSLTPFVKYVLIISTASFLIGKLFLAAGSAFWIRTFGLTPTMVTGYFTIWQFTTYIFMHDGLWHLLFNMFALWMFGGELERNWGSREFGAFFLLIGTVVGLLYAVFASGLPLIIDAGSPGQVLIGSSGAIFGVLAAYGMCFPNRQVLFMLIFPIPAKYFVLLLAGIELYLMPFQSNVSHFAHLSGMLIAYIYLKKDWSLSTISDKFYERRRRKRIRLVEQRQEHEEQGREEVDRVLDKISCSGIESLSKRERKILESASRKGRRKED